MFDNYSRYGYTSYSLTAKSLCTRMARSDHVHNISPSIPINGGTTGIQSSTGSMGLQFSTIPIISITTLHYCSTCPRLHRDVQPAYGLVGEGDEADITITYDSEGYDPGDYEQNFCLKATTRAIRNSSSTTRCTYTPGTICWQRMDLDDMSPLVGVQVDAGPSDLHERGW